APLTLGQLLLDDAFTRAIANGDEQGVGMPARIVDRTHRELYVACRVAAAPTQRDACGAAAFDGLVANPAEPERFAAHEYGADAGRRQPAEQPRGGLVPQPHLAVELDDDQRVGDDVDEGGPRRRDHVRTTTRSARATTPVSHVVFHSLPVARTPEVRRRAGGRPAVPGRRPPMVAPCER